MFRWTTTCWISYSSYICFRRYFTFYTITITIVKRRTGQKPSELKLAVVVRDKLSYLIIYLIKHKSIVTGLRDWTSPVKGPSKQKNVQTFADISICRRHKSCDKTLARAHQILQKHSMKSQDSQKKREQSKNNNIFTLNLSTNRSTNIHNENITYYTLKHQSPL